MQRHRQALVCVHCTLLMPCVLFICAENQVVCCSKPSYSVNLWLWSTLHIMIHRSPNFGSSHVLLLRYSKSFGMQATFCQLHTGKKRVPHACWFLQHLCESIVLWGCASSDVFGGSCSLCCLCEDLADQSGGTSSPL